MDDDDDRMLPGLWRLSSAGSAALSAALRSLPNDAAAPAPLCERIAQLLDVIVPLTKRADLDETDREILRAFCLNDRRLQNFAELTLVIDVAQGARDWRERVTGLTIKIHVLHNGYPLCRFSGRLPGQWPAGHIWIRAEEYEATAEACNDPAHELHAVVPYEMCPPCGRAMLDPPSDHVIPSEGRTCERCSEALVPSWPAIYCSNECAFADAAGPVANICPECHGYAATTALVEETFPYGDAREPHAQITLSAIVPRHSCPLCGFTWTDHKAEVLRDEAVRKHLAKPGDST